MSSGAWAADEGLKWSSSDGVDWFKKGETGYNQDADYQAGEYSADNNASNQNVIIDTGATDPLQSKYIYGGYSLNKDATNNTITMTGGEANVVYGGRNNGSGSATDNTVTMTGGEAKFVFGGRSVSGAVTGNTVTIIDGTVTDNVYGGSNSGGSKGVTGNTVTISGDTVIGTVYGGFGGGSTDVTGNTVSMSGGKVNLVVGGRTGSGAATGNIVIMTGGQADKVYGGWGEFGGPSVTGNIVIMTGGQADNVYGGWGESGGPSVTGNTVVYSGGKIEGSLFGGRRGNNGTSENNTLISIGNRSVGGDVGYFQNYSFVLDADQNVGITAGKYIMDANTNHVTSIDALGGGSSINVGDTLFLIKAAASDVPTGAPVTGSGTGKKGVSLLFDWKADPANTVAHSLTATVTNVRAHPQTKSVLEGRIAGITTVNQAGDMLAGKGIAAASAVTETTGFGIYAATSGGTNRYKTGSHVDLDSISFMLGAGWRKNTGTGAFLFSPFFEFGWGKYKAHNDFSGFADVNAKGNTNYQGGGLLARYDHCNGVYAEASFRLGRLHQSYNTSDLADVMGRRGAHYKYNQLYTSLHLGIGRKFALGMGELDVYGKYFWTRTGKKDVTIIDDPISFDATHSHRMRLGARYTHAVSEAVKPYAGAGFEYEFAGKAKGKAYRLYDINSPRIKGGSGLLEAGIDYAPCGKKWAINGGVTGFVGKRRGIMGQLGIKADF